MIEINLLIVTVFFLAIYFGLSAGSAAHEEKVLLKRLLYGQRVIACYLAIIVAILAAFTSVFRDTSP